MELKTTEEFVREAHGVACSTWKTKIEKEFPELFKTELEAGKWYYNKKYDIVFRLTELKCEGVYNGYGFDKNKEWFNTGNIYSEYCDRAATQEETESYLISEAKRRGYKKGVNFNCMLNGRIEFGSMSEDYYFYNDGTMYNSGGYIFKDGIWATILPEQKTIITKEKALKILAKKLKVSPESIEIN